MRLERTGVVAPLTPQIVNFLAGPLGGVSLDDLHSPEATRIDYSCLGGLVAVELKTLEEAGTGRLNNLTEQLRQRDDWPIYLGTAPIDSFISKTNDPHGLRRRVIDRVGRAVLNHLKKANRQLEAHAAAFPRRAMVRLLLLVNEDHEIYDPHTVSYILGHAVRRMEGGRPLYDHVDGIMFITQRHATVVDGRLTYPILMVQGAGCNEAPWKAEVLDFIVSRWASANGHALQTTGSVEDFVTIDHIPEKAPNHERWRIEYKRRPYLRSLSKAELRERFDETVLVNMLGGLKHAPIKLPMDQWMVSIQRFGDFMLEMGERGIPITEFPTDIARLERAARRLGLTQPVLDWLGSLSTG